MQTVDSLDLHERVASKRYVEARTCEHFAKDKDPGPAIWHSCFCTHPDTPDPEITGSYEHCFLVWQGACPFKGEQ